ncbi:translation initiation factor IF-3 [Haliscomenobacter hydrossis]|uniref:Translation initiation factor IF-3 n=1 Tax=Haliscomenobacter hydrossis (strain ATCC 27775 / DSM 1100 / LMG 10767 / O) TaxID=760192 RepID=F4L4Q2_HALH1|nr:translation initiation factor IF-3 [Haliscomenobacter hydrossis]AEE53000.1 Translation initiation factor IF-3 [Haliscomenobacter hydrossis DSM 1100]
MAKNQFGGNRSGGGSRPPFNRNRRDSRFPSEEDKGQFRLNDQIRVPQIRLVGDNMEQLSEFIGVEIKSGEVYNTRDALQWAEKSELDLVEISPNAVPPVVRIIDYNKFLYEKKKKEKEIKAKAAKTVIKEIRFGPNTDDHDFEFKVRHAKTFLEENAKVKAYVNFRGRTIVFKDRGELLLLKFLKELEEFGSPESLPKLEGRRMIVMIAPKKKK